MKVHCLSLFVCLCLSSVGLYAQTEQSVIRAAKGKEGVDPNSIVSINADVMYSKAIQLLGEMSKKLDGKILIDRSPMHYKDNAIGVNIESMYWKDALELILRSNQLWYKDNPEYIEIVSLQEMTKSSAEQQPQQQQQPQQAPKDNSSNSAMQAPPSREGKPPAMNSMPPAVVPKNDSGEALAKVREVTISVVFFELDTKKVAESGISFSFFRGNNLNLGVNLYGAEQMVNQYTSTTSSTTVPYYGVSAAPSGMSVDMSAAMAIFETNQLGEILSRPQITVRSGSPANIQIGQDISVLEKDFSGNTVSKFYPTGTILNATPTVYTIKGVDYIDLSYTVEKSSATTTSTGSTIDKQSAKSSLLLLNGEEGYVGGMYSNQVSTTRTGVPILKDLPWWVFGLRYIFGYNYELVNKRELIVLMKAEIVPTVEERAAQREKTGKRNVIQEIRNDTQKDIEKHSTKK
jgi:general secretion pathway protein D